MNRRAIAVVLLCAVTFAAPPADADHEYSHRLEVVGRALDADGEPVPGAPLTLEVLGVNASSRCILGAPAEERTNETGDFHLCRHMHAMDAPVTVRVTLGNLTTTASVDPALRRVYLPLRVPEPWPVGSIQGQRAFEAQYVVTGRAVDLHPEPVKLENVEVPATPRTGAPVNVTLLDASGATLAEGRATTGEFGDFAVHLPIRDVPDGARVHVALTHGARVAEAPVDIRRADVTLIHEVAASRPATPPGSGTGDIPGPGAPLVLAALGVVAVLSARRLVRGG